MTSLPIQIPNGYKIIVKLGDNVTTGVVLAKKDSVENVFMNISKALSINPKLTKKYLKKNPGDSVSEGEVIASRSKLFGMQEEKILSHITGTVATFDRTTGNLGIVVHEKDGTQTVQNDEIRSPIDGIIELCDNDFPESSTPDASFLGRVVIKTDKNVIPGVNGVGNTVEGDVYVIEEESKKPEEAVVQLHHLTTDIIDKVLVGGSFDRDVLIKAIGMGVAGILGVTIRNEDMEHIKERNLGVPVISVDLTAFAKLEKWKGKKVFVNGSGKTILFLQK